MTLNRASGCGAPLDRRGFLATGAAAGAGFALGCRPSRPTGGRTLIDGATVFDVRSGRMRPSTSILIDGERIAAVDAASRLGPSSAAAAGAHRIDGAGRFVIPGLIDGHVHLTHILYQSRMTGDETLPLYLGHGVTAVRSTGDNVPAQKLIERFADDRPETSPRIFRASFLIDGQPPWHPDIGWALTDPAAVAPFVADMAAWEVTTLKLYIGVSRDIGRRVIDEAHARGLVVAGHLLDYPTADAVRDGLDSVEHIYTVSNFLLTDPEDPHSIDLDSDEARRLLDTIAETGARVDPTLIVFWGTLLFMDQPEVIDHPDNVVMPERLRGFWGRDRQRRMADWGATPIEVRRETWRKYMRLTEMLRAAGVPLLAGTDAPEPQVAPGTSLHHELEFLVEAGLSETEALTAATLENARVVRADDRIGAIEPGMLADLVLLDADPLVDITNTRRIQSVIRGGLVLDPATILQAAPAA